MTVESAVSVEQLGKTYRVYARPWHRAAEALFGRPRHREFHALADVSFELPRGQGLGLVGENGAGKSTLLKILAGIVAPSHGRVAVHGKVASILELGSGFHPEFTGRQNIVLNAAMLGLTEPEVRAKTPEIIAWSELGDFIDQPVKTYSTGMAMRLGFAIATQVDPEVLIIDEALSVGDGYFQKKCMDKIAQYLAGGGTLLFCSHAMYYVSAFCQQALWLRQGRVAALGPVPEVVREYESHLQGRSAAAQAEPTTAAAPAETERPGPARLESAQIFGLTDHEGRFAPGEPWRLDVRWQTEDPNLAFHVGVGLNRADGLEVASFSSFHAGRPAWSGARSYEARLTVPELPLVKGDFVLYVFLLDERGLHLYDQLLIAPGFRVENPHYSFGVVQIPHHWDDRPTTPLAHVPEPRLVTASS
ncbi:MAG: ABC transporter ATP-binding protein [Thermoanaerobaculia bacterium]|nr:ABC transporter ATP-binding protein [Thermoanaerobaculia bacterium]